VHKAHKARSNEEGFILITVLLVIALLFPLVLAFNSKVQLNLTQAENFRNSVQALRMARAGVEGAMGILEQGDQTYDSRRSIWASNFPSFSPTEGGVLTVSINDEDGKLPINNVITVASPTPANKGGTTQTAAANPAQTAAANPAQNTAGSTGTTTAAAEDVNQIVVTQVKSLISQFGGRPEITDALIDWIDADSIVTGSEGAEEDYYKPLGYHCKNGLLDSVDELLLIRGFDRELVIDKSLKDYVTIAPTSGGINVNTAPLEVLKAVVGTQTGQLVQPLSESDIENLVQYRDQHDLKTINDITGAVKISQTQLSSVSSLLKVKSSYFTASSRYTIGKVVKNVEALLKRDGSTVTIISWREF
jgi:general secretion pathway protein K